MEMVPPLRVVFIRCLLGSQVIWKTKNVAAGNKQIKIGMKHNPGNTTSDVIEILHVAHMSSVRHLKMLD